MRSKVNRILHIGPDDLWFDHGLEALKVAQSCESDVKVIGSGRRVRHVSQQHRWQIPSSILATRSFVSSLTRKGYAAVIFHSLPGPKTEINPLIRLTWELPSTMRVGWIGWGYDYYDLIFGKDGLPGPLLPLTRTVQDSLKRTSPNSVAERARAVIADPRRATNKLFSHLLSAWGKNLSSSSGLFDRFDVFSPHLRSEYDLINSVITNLKPSFQEFEIYGPRVFEPLQTARRHGSEVRREPQIVLGNSASFNVNHLDAFQDLLPSLQGPIPIHLPIAYGDGDYAKYLEEWVATETRAHMEVRKELVSPKEYATWLARCSAFIHAGLRQHAGWNIRLVLASGGKVYLRPENPLYSALRNQGFPVRSLSYLHEEPTDLTAPYSHSDRIHLNAALEQFLDPSRPNRVNRNFLRFLLA